MSDEPQPPEINPNKMDFPDSLFGENSNATVPAQPVANVPETRHDLSIILGILAAFICLLFAAGAGGFYLFNQYTGSQNTQKTATAQAIAAAQATNLAYATGTARVVATQARATAAAQATLDANATATLAAHLTERVYYEFVETFDDNRNKWRSAKVDNDFWSGETSIENGTYIWDVKTVKEAFIAWGSYDAQKALGDFDVYVEALLHQGDPDKTCYGILFHESPDGFDKGAYAFSVCESGYFQVSYYDKENGWDQISEWQTSPSIKAGDWNLLEISARGDHFDFRINNTPVYAMDDARQSEGFVSLYVDIYEKIPAVIWFDNFGLQSR